MISTRLECRSPRGTWSFQTSYQVIELLKMVEGVLGDAGYLDDDVFAVRLALEEALVNAIKHGHKDDSSKQAVLRFEVTNDRVWAEVEDEGPGFCPESVPDPLAPENLEKPSGRGLFLMRVYMTTVVYNERGNRVTLCKQRKRS